MMRAGWLFGALALLALCAPQGSAYGAETFLTHSGTAAARPEITVLSENDDGIQIEFDLSALEVETFAIGTVRYQTLAVPGGDLHGAPGAPALPAFTRYMEIPLQAGIRLSIVATTSEVLSGYRILPMQDLRSEAFRLDEELYALDQYLGGDLVTAGPPAVLRARRVVPLTFRPLQYNPLRGEIRVARRIVVEITYDGIDLRNTSRRPATPATAAFDRLYHSVVVNPGGSTGGRPASNTGHLGTWLVISRDDPQVTDLIQPLIEWRRRMGYTVRHATTTETGGSAEAIKAWIQEAYDTWEDPPGFIAIIGDNTGAFSIPTFYDPWSLLDGEGDHPYVQLDGDDHLPEAAIGRLSAEDTTTLQRIINKIVGYESTPFIAETDWFDRACLTGDPSTSGVSCVQIQQWLKEKLLATGYAQVDTVFAEPFQSQTLNFLDQGNSFYGYRGFAGVSGITVGDILALQNGRKLTFAVLLTCVTGDWAHGTSFNEAWLRAGIGTSTPTAGIGAISTATGGTHTRYNNCFYAGTAYGLFWEDHHQIGMAQARGKVEMVLNYGDYEPTQAARYCYWNTLMGDPATELWTGYPQPIQVSFPATVAQGANLVALSVHDEGDAPLAGARVCLYRQDQIHVVGETDALGQVVLPINTSQTGTVQVTVTGHNLHPFLGSLDIVVAEQHVGLDTCEINDGSTQGAQGNNDGEINPGERVALGITLVNTGTQAVTDVTLTIGNDDPFVGLLQAGPFAFGDIPAGTSATSPAAPLLAVAQTCPSGHGIQLILEVEASTGAWTSLLELQVSGADLVYSGHELAGVGPTIDPGETGTLTVELHNAGSYPATGPIQAILASDSYALTVADPQGGYGTIDPGGTGGNSGDPFEISARPDCIPGQMAPLRIFLTFADGTRDTVRLSLTVGSPQETDPTGPDTYGYFAYDHTDTAYPHAPVYAWLDIAAPENLVGLTDFSDGEDDSRTVDLPFPFTFYGQTFSQVTICSNGWLSMGQTYLTNYRNWNLPSACGPANMVAAFWDDLRQDEDGFVYHWFDEANHRYIVSWDDVERKIGWWEYYPESFQIILYDPAWYPTQTGDGEIVFQYAEVNNLDAEQMYCTVGIQDQNHTTGITCNYFNDRPPTVAALAEGLAIRFTTTRPGAASLNPEAPAALDQRARLLIEPNPCTAGATIRYHLSRSQAVELWICDLDGRVVQTLARGTAPAGTSRLFWDGHGDQGQPLPSGMYFLRLRNGTDTSARPLIVIR